MARIDILAKRLEQQIDSVIAQRLGKISNPTIRKAIEDSLRDQVYENIGDMVAGQVDKVVDDSMNDIINSIQGNATKRKPTSKTSRSFGTSSSGSKSSASGSKSSPSGSKSSNQNIPTRRSSSGGKSGRGFGGK